MGRVVKVSIGIGVGIIMLLVSSYWTSMQGYQQMGTLQYQQLMAMIGSEKGAEERDEVRLMRALKEMKAEDVARGMVIADKYGYSEVQLPSVLDTSFRALWLWQIIQSSLVIGGIGVIGGGIYYFTSRRLRALQKYLIELARGNYHLNIEGIGEGKFSVLEDEIYKTTVALREGKEVQEKEKLQLARNIADISHQLKTPLTSMGIMTELLGDSELDALGEQALEQIEQQVERMEGLVRGLLKLAKFDSGTVQLKEEKVAVQPLIEEITDMLAAIIKQKKIQITTEGDNTSFYTGDKKWSFEALHNVIYNCIQHSKEGGSMHIGWEQNPIYTEIHIQDEAGGIAKEDLPHLFERFYKGKKATKASLGIGLAMTKTIIESQKGEVRVKNTTGGCRFTIKMYH
ncbi:MAG: sensor histidine kinase [Cellulosilyticaceae bacterium]